MCGYQRCCTPSQPLPKLEIDLDDIDSRLQQLNAYAQASSYSKQKSSLRTEFESFLSSLPTTTSIQLATPLDVIRFLVWKDRHGKTILHTSLCPQATVRRKSTCNCPTRLAFKTIDSYIGKLRSIFKEIGRTGPWNTILGLGNPADSLEVNKYLKATTEGTVTSTHHPTTSSSSVFTQTLTPRLLFE
jgi:hypothetical protein